MEELFHFSPLANGDVVRRWQDFTISTEPA